MKYQVLVIDDEPDIIDLYLDKKIFSDYDFYVYENIESAINVVKEKEYDLILLDLNLVKDSGRLEGLDYILPIKKIQPDTPLVIVTKHRKREIEYKAVNELGADDFLRKNEPDYNSWLNKFKHLIDIKNYKKREEELYPFIGNSTIIRNIKEELKIAATNPNITCLITGETGVGKEMAAHYVHRMSIRRIKPFVAVHFSEIPDNILESSLFGHKKGAYTNAIEKRQGFFRRANHGILFLDELGDINPVIQAKLLRFLENKTIRAIGDDFEQKLDIQIILATKEDIINKVRRKEFREDLYYRIHKTIEIPPLRNRKEDIFLLLKFFLNSRGYELPNDVITEEVMEEIHKYSWPGNIRQLKLRLQTMLQNIKKEQKNKIDLECFYSSIREDEKLSKSPIQINDIDQINSQMDFKDQEALIEIKYDEARLSLYNSALEKTYGKKDAAAELLGITPENLRAKILSLSKKYPNKMNSYSCINKYYKLS